MERTHVKIHPKTMPGKDQFAFTDQEKSVLTDLTLHATKAPELQRELTEIIRIFEEIRTKVAKITEDTQDTEITISVDTQAKLLRLRETVNCKTRTVFQVLTDRFGITSPKADQTLTISLIGFMHKDSKANIRKGGLETDKAELFELLRHFHLELIRARGQIKTGKRQRR